MVSEIPLPTADPAPDPAPSSRRNLLTAALAGVAGLVAGRLGTPEPVAAAPGSVMVVGAINDGGASQTILKSTATGASFTLRTDAIATGSTGIFGHTASTQPYQTRGVYGLASGANSDGVQGVQAGPAGSGAAVRAIGGNNTGLVATTSNGPAAAVRAVHSLVSAANSNEPAILALASSGLETDPHPSGRYLRAGVEVSGPNGIIGAGSSETSDGWGVIGIGKGTTAHGVHGNALGTSGTGISAEANSSTGTTYGVRATAASTAGTGVLGQANATSGTTYGVRAIASSNSGYGLHATNLHATGGTAGYMESEGTNGWALHLRSPYVGLASYSTAATGSNYGIYTSAVSGYALYAEGNAVVTGTLSKGGGAFKIDHPLDPENKYLLHSFVESPDMKNVYDGVVKLDAQGEATVELPAWFEALNRDFRYQLTAMGSSAPDLYVKSGVKGNAFTIAGGKAGQEVSWLLTGIRKDAWADANRIPVEEKKKGDEKGRYLHPKEHGKSADQGMDLKPHGKPAPAPIVEKATVNQGNQ